ncbi:enoyl-CoA hydratase/isomerase family protein [Pseudonocardia xinjiangensis]|uniref:Enoyl-CoA hydratase n=1 Tax=Pseudonocardia xinjiangensis TaxID=75289 RepID=A0ABX1RMP5_9PSEU|nr:enoyl-CoA hydratase-related protein [Pseudonocardia xinjiangensis]NMH81662.1 enoyl-CoA hydratase [Pseudonocardia xinjiangensis]
MADLEYTVADGIGTILLNRPHRKNAFTLDMIDVWAQALRDARTDPDVRVVVLTGAGDAFCSGVDLDRRDAAGPPTPLQRKEHLTERIHRIAYAMEDLDKPVIAGINGVAVGAGMDMALMCDMRIMARSARLSEGYVRVGLVPGDGGCYYLPRLVGTAKALELLLTGDFIDAEEAGRLGIANHVVDDADFVGAVTTLARKIADGPPVAIRTIKRAVYQSARSDLRTALDLISSHMAVVTSTDDSAEALAAFREKRPGRFVGH